MKSTRCWFTAGFLVLFVAGSAFAGTPIKTVKPDGAPNRAAWMAQGGYRGMIIYLPDSQFIDNGQWHCLLPVDLTFNPAVPNQFCHYGN